MKKIILVSLVSLLAATQVEAKGLEGFYVGAKLGYNDSSESGAANVSVARGFIGGEAGYNWVKSERMLIGVDLWVDDHKQTVTNRDYGADLKLGGLQDNFVFYVKLGVAETHPGVRPHYGLGAEQMLGPNWGAMIEFTYDSITNGGINYTNNKYFIGANYHF